MGSGETVVAKLAPVGIALRGMRGILFGALVLSLGLMCFLGPFDSHGYRGQDYSIIFIVQGFVFSLAGFVGAVRGFTLLLRARAKGYFLVGKEKISLRFPQQGILTCPIHSYVIPWSEVRAITIQRYNHGIIPVNTELLIERHEGKTIEISSYLFDSSVGKMQQMLLRVEEERRLQSRAQPIR